MVSKVLFSSQTEEWNTPLWLFDTINNSMYPIDLDPCTTEDNPLNTPYICIKNKNDGLKQDWYGNVFVNPPYNKEITKWLDKAYHELKNNRNVHRIIFLLPARTDTKWFHQYIFDDVTLQYREMIENVWFIKGRLKFGGSKNSAPFPSMVIIMFNKKHKLDIMHGKK